jgi:hypothetical protein
MRVTAEGKWPVRQLTQCMHSVERNGHEVDACNETGWTSPILCDADRVSVNLPFSASFEGGRAKVAYCWSRARASRLPRPRTLARLSSCAARGRAPPCSHL